MNTTILPLKRRGDKLSVRRENDSPVMTIQNEMNRMFDQFFNDPFTLVPFSSSRSLNEFMPRIDVSETETTLTVTAELPGMEEKDIQITMDRDALILSGEKKTDLEEKGKNFHKVERSYGSFQRVIPLVSEVDADKVEAAFKNGVLTITCPKPASAVKQSRKINIKSG
jgi:HSP20 family protein